MSNSAPSAALIFFHPTTHHYIIKSTSINPSSYLAITKSTQLTPVQASSTYIQMSGDRGLRKENTPGLVPLGLRQRMLIPKVMKGLEKSMTFSLTQVMVKGATARSATLKSQKTKKILQVKMGTAQGHIWLLSVFVSFQSN